LVSRRHIAVCLLSPLIAFSAFAIVFDVSRLLTISRGPLPALIAA